MDKYFILTVAIYLIVINLTGIVIMGTDKNKARHEKWRIPEKTFFIIALIGGSLGIWTGMYLFRHKTKHWYFVIGIPAILAAQIALCVYLWTQGYLKF